MKRILIIALIFLTLVVGCEEKADDSSYNVVTASEHIFTLEELESIGFKKNKKYDVSGLEGALIAVNGFWSTDIGKKEYELRFYPSHSVAVSLGESLAQEATGEDAIIKKSDATWKEGIKDRRRSQRTSGSHPKYGNYSIYGNVVMLCEGQVGISLEVCWGLISAMEKLEY
jgi:hypothetical protein